MKHLKNPPRKFLALALVLTTLMLTGCPHDDYLVQLKPEGNHIERTLTLFTADGADTNGTPNYKPLDAEELAAIASIYAEPGLTNENGQPIFQRLFTNALPPDVGGAGSYTNLATSLGEAGFYVERFRGNDDLAGMLERRLRAANQLADQILGWSQMTLGKEPGHDQLHQFLDVEFRRDLKNLGLFCWEGTLAARYSTNASEEFIARYGQYLQERGYFTIGELPGLFTSLMNNDSGPLLGHIQRLVARKMGVPDTEPLPASLVFLSKESTVEESFFDYLATTEEYHARLKQWQEDRKLKPELNQPRPEDVAGDEMQNLVDLDLFEEPDHLAVHLSLPEPPTRTNGRWDQAQREVIWDTALEERSRTNGLPVTCYAIWVRPDEHFQKRHFGKVALKGDDLTIYCLWRGSLALDEGSEWDNFLVSLRPGSELTNEMRGFKFSGKSQITATNRFPDATTLSAVGAEILIKALN